MLWRERCQRFSHQLHRHPARVLPAEFTAGGCAHTDLLSIGSGHRDGMSTALVGEDAVTRVHPYSNRHHLWRSQVDLPAAWIRSQV